MCGLGRAVGFDVGRGLPTAPGGVGGEARARRQAACAWGGPMGFGPGSKPAARPGPCVRSVAAAGRHRVVASAGNGVALHHGARARAYRAHSCTGPGGVAPLRSPGAAGQSRRCSRVRLGYRARAAAGRARRMPAPRVCHESFGPGCIDARAGRAMCGGARAGTGAAAPELAACGGPPSLRRARAGAKGKRLTLQGWLSDGFPKLSEGPTLTKVGFPTAFRRLSEAFRRPTLTKVGFPTLRNPRS